MQPEQWVSEIISLGEKHCHKINNYLYRQQGQYHKLEIVETASYGRGLFLDDRIQHVEFDEYIYSEGIAHPGALILGEKCRQVLVVGGGPGGAIREILKHRSVKHVTQVEVDSSIIELTKKYLSHISQNYHDNPKVEIIIADIRDYLNHNQQLYDLIIYDVSEPLVNSPAQDIFDEDLLANIRDHLSSHGLFVSWAGSAGPCSNELSKKIIKKMHTIFPHNTYYLCHTQSYGTAWLFNVGALQATRPLHRTMDEIDQKITQSVVGDLRLYDGMTHYHMFLLPKDIRQLLLEAILETNEDKVNI